MEDQATLASLGASSKLNAEKAFIDMLFQKGRTAAESWLAEHFDDLGKRSTVKIRELFGGEEDACVNGLSFPAVAVYDLGVERSTLSAGDVELSLAISQRPSSNSSR